MEQQNELPRHIRYYYANKEKSNTRSMKWFADNAERWKEYQKQYRNKPENKTKMLEYQRQYRLKKKLEAQNESQSQES